MKLKIEIDLGNDAFASYAGIEVARILRLLAAQVDGQQLKKGFYATLTDSNGNTVGKAKVTK